MDSTNSTGGPRGLARDIERIKVGGTATAAELREFIGSLKGKRPQEVMGAVTGSGLVQCTTLATIITTLFLALFTVGPYVWNKLNPVAKTAQAAPAAATTAQPTAPASAQPAATQPEKNTAPAKNDAPPTKGETAKSGAPPIDPLEPSAANKQKALEKLGIGETKASDPKKNPLENSADDLLKDLK